MKNKIFIVLFFMTILLNTPIMIKKLLPVSLSMNEVATKEPIVVASKDISSDIINNVKAKQKNEIKNNKI
jgi:hypothetical protein